MSTEHAVTFSRTSALGSFANNETVFAQAIIHRHTRGDCLVSAQLNRKGTLTMMAIHGQRRVLRPAIQANAEVPRCADHHPQNFKSLTTFI